MRKTVKHLNSAYSNDALDNNGDETVAAPEATMPATSDPGDAVEAPTSAAEDRTRKGKGSCTNHGVKSDQGTANHKTTGAIRPAPAPKRSASPICKPTILRLRLIEVKRVLTN